MEILYQQGHSTITALALLLGCPSGIKQHDLCAEALNMSFVQDWKRKKKKSYDHWWTKSCNYAEYDLKAGCSKLSPCHLPSFHGSVSSSDIGTQISKTRRRFRCSNHPVSQTLDHASTLAEAQLSPASVQVYLHAFQSMDFFFFFFFKSPIIVFSNNKSVLQGYFPPLT